MAALNQELKKGDRIPPHSEEAERIVLGSALVKPVWTLEICVFKALSADSFYIPAHRLLFKHLQAMYQNAQDINLLTVGEDLKKTGRLDQVGGQAFLEGLISSTPATVYDEGSLDIIRSKQLLRLILAQADEMVDRCCDPVGDAEEIICNATKALFQLSDLQVSDAEKWEDVIARQAEKIVSKVAQDEGLLTGFTDLDKILRGLHNTDLIILAGHPSIGKTSLAMNIAEHAALGHPDGKKHAVGVFSMELSQEALVRRMLYSNAEVPTWKNFLSEADQKRLLSAADQLRRASIIVDDSVGLDIMDLRARAHRMKKIHGIELLIIEDLQQLEDSRCSAAGRKQENGSVARSIKALAKELKIPVLLLCPLGCQTQTGSWPGKPRLSDLHELGDIDRHADVVMLLSRPSYYGTTTDFEDTLAIVDIVKHQRGFTGEVKLNFFRDIMRFRDRGYCPTVKAAQTPQSVRPKRKRKPKTGPDSDCLNLS